jgi:hypothetical protein
MGTAGVPKRMALTSNSVRDEALRFYAMLILLCSYL